MKVWDEKGSSRGSLDLYMDGKRVVSVRNVGECYRARAYLGSGMQEKYFDKKPLAEIKKEAEAWYAGQLKDRLTLMAEIAENYKKQIETLGVPDSLDQQIQDAKSQVEEMAIGAKGRERSEER